MWQRIQTLYLLLVILIQWGSLSLPIGSYSDGDDMEKGLYLLGDIATTESIVFSVLITLIASWAIAMFKNRKKQMQLCRLLAFVIIIALITTIVSVWIFVGDQPNMPKFYYANLIFPIATISFSILAKRAIRKDDELVRSSNRLR